MMPQNLNNAYQNFFKHGGFFNLPCHVFKFEGEKAASFLHGQVSNDIKNLKTGEGNYNLLLTTKGKVIADFLIHCFQNGYYLVVDQNFSACAYEHFARLAPLSRVKISDLSVETCIMHVCGQSTPHAILHVQHFTSFPSTRLGFPGYDVLIPIAKKDEWIKGLSEHSLEPLPFDLQEILRVEQGIARVGQDVTEKNLPQEGRLDRALHYNKGCYLGQEIVARLHYLGHVNKLLCGLKVEGFQKMEPGEKILKEGHSVGHVTSCIQSQALQSILCLGYVPYQQSGVGTKFQVGKTFVPAELVELPIT